MNEEAPIEQVVEAEAGAAEKPAAAEPAKVPKAAAKLTKADFLEAVYWVFDVVGTKNVARKRAPSAGAWNLYKWARLKGNRAKFYSTFASKLLPSKRQVDQEDERKDDGRKLIKTIDILREARRRILQEAGAEGS